MQVILILLSFICKILNAVCGAELLNKTCPKFLAGLKDSEWHWACGTKWAPRAVPNSTLKVDCHAQSSVVAQHGGFRNTQGLLQNK